MLVLLKDVVVEVDLVNASGPNIFGGRVREKVVLLLGSGFKIFVRLDFFCDSVVPGVVVGGLSVKDLILVLSVISSVSASLVGVEDNAISAIVSVPASTKRGWSSLAENDVEDSSAFD